MLTPPYSDSDMATPPRGLQVAIVGGGVTGMTLALGLEARGVSYTLYERHPEFREIGAGFGFSPNAEAALKVLNPKLHAAFRKVAMQNGEDYFQWVDGFETDEVTYKLYLGERMFEGCRRSDFLDELVKLIPKEKVKLGKAAERIDELSDGRTRLQFSDGTGEIADVGKSWRVKEIWRHF